jgi:TatD DNase family protein
VTAAPFVDTHCHLDAYFRPAEPAQAAERANVHVIAVTNLPSHRQRLQARLPLAQHVRFALGIHPSEAAKMNDGEWQLFVAKASVAEDIGEVGLDFSPGADRTLQERVFARVLSIVRDRPRFITVHSRRAVRPVLKHLAEARIKAAVLHWFSGSSAELDAALDAGHLLSINIAMIASAKGIKTVRALPRDRVLAETDGPYARHRGEPASPSDVIEVYAALARFWNVELNDVRAQLARNLEAVRAGTVALAPSLF